MGTTPRLGKPYVFATWITKILASENQCHYAPWFKSHFKYDKWPDLNFNCAAWTAEHNELVSRWQATLENAGYTVRSESQNDIRLHGHTAILAAKPDLVAYRPGEIRISDGKTGKQRHSDFWQVLIYMLGFDKTRPEALMGARLHGEVVYREGVTPVSQEELTEVRKQAIFAVLREMGSDTPPRRVPSRQECSFCDLPDCPDRVKEEEAVLATAEEF